MSRDGHKVVRLFGMAVIAAALGLPVSVSAAIRIWNGAGDGTTWSDGNNWQGGVAPEAGDDIEFSIEVEEGAATIYINVDAPQTIGSMYFNRVTQSHGDSYVITNHALTVSPSGRWATRDIYVLTSTVEIHCDIVMDDDLIIQVSGAATYPCRIYGSILDNGNDHALTLDLGNNTPLYLHAANLFSGGLTVKGGTGALYLAQPTDPLGTGTIRLTGSTRLFVEEDTTISVPLVIENSFEFERYRNHGRRLAFTGPISLDEQENIVITVYGSVLALDGNIAASATTTNLTFTRSWGNAGGMQLGGSNTFSGSLTLNMGAETAILTLANSHALAGDTLIAKGNANTSGIRLRAKGAKVAIEHLVMDNLNIARLETQEGGTLIVGGSGAYTVNRVKVHSNTVFAIAGAITLGSPNYGDALVGIGHTSHANINNVAGQPDATLSPAGDGAGILTISGGPLLFWNETARLILDLNGSVPGAQHDQLVLNDGDSRLRTHSVAGRGAALVPRVGGSIQPDAKLFIVVNNSGNAIENVFDGLSQGATVDLGEPFGRPASCIISYEGDAVAGAISGGHDIVLYDFVNTTPPPGTLFLVR